MQTSILEKPIQPEILTKAKQIRLLIFDVDGVLTDGSLYIDDSGQEYKAFNSKDGLGIKMLQSTGVEIAIISGRTSEVVKHRMLSLGIDKIYLGQINKVPAFEQICTDLNLSPQQVAYVGDDVIDNPVMLKAGLAISVADAHPLTTQYADWQTSRPGGRGAAREVCELIMLAQDNWEQQLNQFDLPGDPI